MKGRSRAILILLLALVTLIVGCSGNGTNEGASPSAAPSAASGETAEPGQGGAREEPFQFSIMVDSRANNDVTRILPIIEEYTNTKVDFRWTPNYAEVMPVSMAAGDLPDAIAFGAPTLRQPFMVNAMRGGVLWDLTDFIADYPNLNSIHPQIYKNISLDGRIYGLPRVRPMARVTIIYRKDWLENLGMSEPTTIDEYYEMLRAFTFDDPNRSGSNDTIGLAERDTAGIGRILSVPFGAPNEWGVNDDGTFYGAWETEEYLDALKFLRRLHSEGIMNSDFPVLTYDQWDELFVSGRAGVYARHIDRAYSFQSTMPDAKLGMISQLEGPHGIRTPGESGSNGAIAFTKKGFPTEESLRRALQYFDDLASEEMSNLFAWGIEGIHYVVEDGKAVTIDIEGYTNEVEHLRNVLLAVHPNDNAMEGKLTEIMAEGEALKRDNIDYAVADPTLPLISPTNAEIGSQLTTIINDAVVRFIMSEIDEDGWRSEVERWRSSGGTKVAAEFAEAYKLAQ